MSQANWLWGAPRVHGELLKLGTEIAESTVAKCTIKHPRRLGQSWRTFLRNHAEAIAAVDFFIVPTIGFKLLYCLVLLAHGRRQLMCYAVTAHPTAGWVAQQIVEAFPWDETPRYLVRAGPRRRPRRGRETAPARAGHPGSTHRADVALAKRLCRAVDQLATTRVHRPRHRARRESPSPDHVHVRRILQRDPNAPVARQGRADWACHRAVWPHRCPTHGRWPAPPLHSNLVFR
jgi:hypothetical protein